MEGEGGDIRQNALLLGILTFINTHPSGERKSRLEIQSVWEDELGMHCEKNTL